MAGCRRALLLCLCLSWTIVVAPGEPGRERSGGLRKRTAGVRGGSRSRAVSAGDQHASLVSPEDKVSEHMLRLYDRYSGSQPEDSAPSAPQVLHLREGNTVRSFRALPAGTPGNKEVHVFNLTSLTKSENILSALLHYYIGDLQNSSTNCPQLKGCPSHGHRKSDMQISLSLLSFPSSGNPTRTLGHYSINISAAYQDVLSWQWKNITHVLNKAKRNNDLLIGVKMASVGRHPWKNMRPNYEPYILVYANDSAISEPESVVSSLQGHWNPLPGSFPKLDSHLKHGLSERRQKRSTSILLPLQNNELPGAEYQYSEDEGWEEKKHYKTLQPRLAERAKNKKKQRKNNHQKSQTLQFDEQTLKKARRKQWNEPRYCARRYLKVDFADIGWSEWIISPKSFDAYYCSGECQFPIPKALKPSNHATIQSIVRAVGVVSGIPEPCCVPDKMSSLSILFFDENKNVVLKVYPNMTVESCACR
ncbi:bone morphogenetic protein 3 [Rhineura floridana]|uniref:bone morphogenetic protein 3 n=1 Tax=Rhineura floridana TaxID=261503 RepID=UPI002AC7E8AD|nr:bone morphogenetic protein 3 [Rhineura floridana]